MPRESTTIKYTDDTVVKVYNSNYFKWNRRYNRKGEPYFLKNYPSPFIVKLIQTNPKSVVIQRCEGALGNAKGFSGLHFARCNKLALVEWLISLYQELSRLGIQHRDLHPGNILKDGEGFKLCDFGWAVDDDDENRSYKSTLNSHYSVDNAKAIDLLTTDLRQHYNKVEIIKEKIERLGVGKYKDGSSTKQGFTYHPIPFSDFGDIPVHKTACRQELETIQQFMSKQGIEKGKRLLDVGCALGHFTFNLTDNFKQCVGVEADPVSAGITKSIVKLYKLRGIEIRSKPLDATDFENYNVMLCLNVHMWMHKQLGHRPTVLLMRQASKHVKHMFFQTSHAESGGKYIIKSLKNKADIQRYLRRCRFRDIRCLSTTKQHRGVRHLFYAQGRL